MAHPATYIAEMRQLQDCRIRFGEATTDAARDAISQEYDRVVATLPEDVQESVAGLVAYDVIRPGGPWRHSTERK